MNDNLSLSPLFTLNKTSSEITLTTFGLTCVNAAAVKIRKHPITNAVSLDIPNITRFLDVQNSSVLSGTILIHASRPNGSTIGIIPVTIGPSSICDYYEDAKKKLWASYYRRATVNQILVPFDVNYLKKETETKFKNELQNRAMAVFSNIRNIVRVSVLEFKKFQTDNQNFRLGFSVIT